MYKIKILLLLIVTFSLSKEIDISKLNILKQKSKQHDTDASFKLGLLYYKGKLVKKNLNLAMLYFIRASIDNNPKAKYNIASIYANKKYKKYNLQKAYSLYLELAKEDYPAAQNMVGLYLYYGVGVDIDYTKSKKWFEYAYFENHYLEAGCNLAYQYTYGKGVFVNLGRARKLAQKGYEKKISRCLKIYNDFKLYKYQKDKGFKFGYYK